MSVTDILDIRNGYDKGLFSYNLSIRLFEDGGERNDGNDISNVFQNYFGFLPFEVINEMILIVNLRL